jgi:DNA-binding NarL/FixJ family response regulator
MGKVIQQPIRIIIAESQEIFRIGLRAVIDVHSAIQVVAESDNVEDIYKLVVSHKPDVILLDLLLCDSDFNDHIPRLIEIRPQSKILAFSINDEKQIHLQVLRSGAAGIITKHESPNLVIKAIYAVNAGQVWFDHHITKLLWQTQIDQQIGTTEAEVGKINQSNLTDRELSIARLASQGFSAKIIGKKLIISEKTVRNQLTIIYEKLEVASQVELCLKANQFGL